MNKQNYLKKEKKFIIINEMIIRYKEEDQKMLQ